MTLVVRNIEPDSVECIEYPFRHAVVDNFIDLPCVSTQELTHAVGGVIPCKQQGLRVAGGQGLWWHAGC